MKEENLGLKIEQLVNYENFEETEIETNESIEKLKYPQEYDSDPSVVTVWDNLNEIELNYFRVQALFKRSGCSNISIVLISQYYYDFTKRTSKTKANLSHIFQPNNFRDVQNFYPDKISTDMTINQSKFSTTTCWN